MSIIVANPSHGADVVSRKLEEIGVQTYVDFVGNVPEFYSDWKSNEHHWTTKFVFEKVMPIVWKFLGVRPDMSEFELVENVVDGHDVSYHRHLGKLRYHVLNLDDACQIHGPHDGLRDVHGKIHNDQFQTCYHRLFVGAHRNCIVKTDGTGSNIRLAMNSDSMAIPVIPLVAPYVQSIFVLDNHKKDAEVDSMVNFRSTHYLNLHSALNAMNGEILKKLWRDRKNAS